MPYDRNNNRRGYDRSDRNDRFDRNDRYDRGPRTGAPKKNVPPSRQDDGPRYGRSSSDRHDRYDRNDRYDRPSRPAPRPVAVPPPVVPVAPAPTHSELDMPENLLVGRNPIREAIKSGRDIEKLLVMKGELSGSAREIVARAHEARIVVQEVDKVRLDAIYPHHQGMLAFVSAAKYASLEDIFETADQR
ncbi:MAG: hypothetical protein IKL85_05500, partial [Lentisphaeria bacterium]|nr:hypothetical protein [Lentisphaeria bacterium]